jgi:hypothetical protein
MNSASSGDPARGRSDAESEEKPPLFAAFTGSQSLQGDWRWAGREVRFGPKTELIPMPNPVAHASRLYNRAEEYGHAGSSECPSAQARALE